MVDFRRWNHLLIFTATYRHLSNLLNRRNPVALPQLTDEQRKEALAKAAEARKARAELKEQLKRGDISLKEVVRENLASNAQQMSLVNRFLDDAFSVNPN